jgi:hypothetical protein
MLVVESGLPTLANTGVSSYDVDTSSGALSVITGSAQNGQTDGCWIVITNDQQFAYTANFINGTISSYRLGANGSATLVNATAAFSGADSNVTDLDFSAGRPLPLQSPPRHGSRGGLSRGSRWQPDAARHLHSGQQPCSGERTVRTCRLLA